MENILTKMEFFDSSQPVHFSHFVLGIFIYNGGGERKLFHQTRIRSDRKIQFEFPL